MGPQIVLEVFNDRTNIHGALPPLLDALDLHLRYPTEVAVAREDGWIAPDELESNWDGWVRLLHRPRKIPPWFPTGLLQEVQRCLTYWQIPHQVADQRVRPDEEIPEWPVIPTRDYQAEAVGLAVDQGRGVLDMVPRSGKTRTMIEVQRRINLRCLWIAPTDRIVTQTLEVFDGLLGERYAHQVVGAKGAQGLEQAKVLLCTAATALRLPDDVYQTRQMIVVDEWHHCFSGTTRVLTDKGPKPICDVRPGDMVWSDGPGGPALKVVTRRWVRPSPGTWLRIKTTHGTFEVTDEHGIYTSKRKIRAGDLRAGSPLRVLQVRQGDQTPGAVSPGRGPTQGRFSGRRGVGGVQDPGRACERGLFLGEGAVLSVERIKARSSQVYDLEVSENHNYFVEGGVKVSNSASSSYRDIFARCDHIYYRFGMTGTFFRSGGDAMAMHALLGNTIYRVTAEDMLRMGHLVPTKVAFMPVATEELPKSMGTFIQGHGKYGIHENRERNWLAAWTALQLQAAGKKTLVLVGTKRQGRAILQDIQRHTRPSEGKFELAEFVSTDSPRPRIAAVLRAFLESNAVDILIGTSLLGEGVDLPVADALVYARGEKAEVSLVQNAYRVGTACEGKCEALIVDFADRHHHKLLAHAQERARIYFEEATFNPTVLAQPEDFFEWSGVRPTGVVRYRD